MTRAGWDSHLSSGVGHCNLGPPPLALLDVPLEYLLAEHMRQRCMCAELRRAAAASRIGRAMADAIVDLLTKDIPLHHEDEERDLFPALLKRTLAEDNLGPIIAQLSQDHRSPCPLAGRLAEMLAIPALTDELELDRTCAALMQAYAEAESHHLAVENAIVMVIARKRLKPEDQTAISQGMKSRRGIPV